MGRNKKCRRTKRKPQVHQRDFQTVEGRQIPLTPEMEGLLHRQIAQFKEKFGREPRADEPIFFDPDADEPRAMPVAKVEALWEDGCKVMEEVGIHPRLIYAARKCGFMLTEENRHWCDEDQLREWHAAMEEYDAARTDPK